MRNTADNRMKTNENAAREKVAPANETARNFQIFISKLGCFFLAHFENFHRTYRAVFKHVHVLEKIERLKDHSDFFSVFRRFFVLNNIHSIEEYLAGRRRFKQIQTAQKR